MRVIESPLHLKSSFLQLSGSGTPDVAPAGMARLYYDAANATVKFSVNGGAYSVNAGTLRLRDLTEQILVAAPAADATMAVVLLDSGASAFSGSASGTALGINVPAAFAGNIFSFQTNQAARLLLTGAGAMTFGAAPANGTSNALLRMGTATFDLGATSAGTYLGIKHTGAFLGKYLSFGDSVAGAAFAVGATGITLNDVTILRPGANQLGLTATDLQITATTVTCAEATDFVFGTTTGSKLGTGATQRIGAYGNTPVVRPAAYTQTYATASRTHSNPTAAALTHAVGTADGTVDDVGASFSQTTLNNNFKEFSTQVNALIVDLANVKQVLNQVVDDLQLEGWLG